MIRLGTTDDHGLALDVIQIDGGTQSRATLNQHVVDDYAEAIKAGATFPSIIVFYDGKKHWLADGFHRFHAYQKAGRTHVNADVRQGTRRDAILHSVGANEAHGLRRTNDDKRRAVLTLLNDAEWAKWSDGEVAKRCAVTREYVNRLRPKDTCDQVTGMERTFVHPKTGEPSTMKIAKPADARSLRVTDGGGEKQEITSQTHAPQGVEGGGEPENVAEEITRLDARTDAERDAYVIQWEWDRASDEGRVLFLARNSLFEQPKVETHDAEACNANSNAVDTASIVTDGSANVEQVDVDRSAERASSAVEVGATVSHSSPVPTPRETKATGADKSPSPSAPVVATRKPLRPYCTRPELCGGYGRNHCGPCEKAKRESEAA